MHEHYEHVHMYKKLMEKPNEEGTSWLATSMKKKIPALASVAQ